LCGNANHTDASCLHRPPGAAQPEQAGCLYKAPQLVALGARKAVRGRRAGCFVRTALTRHLAVRSASHRVIRQALPVSAASRWDSPLCLRTSGVIRTVAVPPVITNHHSSLLRHLRVSLRFQITVRYDHRVALGSMQAAEALERHRRLLEEYHRLLKLPANSRCVRRALAAR
jgi:hypothetical protein